MAAHKEEIRISFAAHLKPVPVAGFVFDMKNSVKSLSKVLHYRKPRIVRAKAGWYIEYYYRIPVELKTLYENKDWYRFRIIEDMNRRKGEEREAFASALRDEIENSLKAGYNPFYPDLKIQETEAVHEDQEREMNATDALYLFLEKWRERGLDPDSYRKYERYINKLIVWLKEKRIPYIEISRITSTHIEKFLGDMKKAGDLSNREYNNHYDFVRTAFNYFLKKKMITESPMAAISKLKTKSTKHRFYDKNSLEQIIKGLRQIDPYILLAFQAVYHLCVRSDKELRNLKVGNIFWEQNKILAEVSKTDQRYIPMDPHIKNLLMDYIGNSPANYYVFGAFNKPSEKMVSHGFFTRRFQKARDQIGLSSDYTLYGAKHTRVIHLKQDGLDDASIMQLTGHKDYSSFAIYMRDLGLDADPKQISKLSRAL